MEDDRLGSRTHLVGVEKSAFATRLRSIMDERGLTARETVRRMREHLPEGQSISAASLSHYRAGRAIPRSQYLDALALALGVKKSELIVIRSEPTRAATHRSTRRTQARGERLRKPRRMLGVIKVKDLGTEVYLTIDQRVPWEVALKVLQVLKEDRGSAAPAQDGLRSTG